MNFLSASEVYQDFEDLDSGLDPLYPQLGQLEPAFSMHSCDELYQSSPRYEYQCSESTCDEVSSSLKSEDTPVPVQPTVSEEPKRFIGRLTYAQRQIKLQHFRAKRLRRVWTRRINYDCRKKVADGRVRYKGRFVKKEDCHLYAPASCPAPTLS